ncbi:hypothetical protein BX666DRAFT_1875609 [Dichotomocladium elegans]|nr:hypothetical protein BX666DRAFT_1875609 [Dichotomocladium elegans]
MLWGRLRFSKLGTTTWKPEALHAEDVRKYWAEESAADRHVTEVWIDNTVSEEYEEDINKRFLLVLESQVVPEAQLKVESTDRIYALHKSHTVGYIIKNAAAERLGLNGILDLGNGKAESQKSLFDSDSWLWLCSKFPPPSLPRPHIVENAKFNNSADLIEKAIEMNNK